MKSGSNNAGSIAQLQCISVRPCMWGLCWRLKWEWTLLPLWETRVRSLSREDPLEEEMTTHSSMLAWIIPRAEEPGGLQSKGSQRVRHDRARPLHICKVLDQAQVNRSGQHTWGSLHQGGLTQILPPPLLSHQMVFPCPPAAHPHPSPHQTRYRGPETSG